MAKVKRAEGVIDTFDVKTLIEELTKLNTPVPRKRKPKPGSILRSTDLLAPGIEYFDKGKWYKLTKDSIVVGHTVAYINSIEKGKYRYPLK